MRYLHTMVRVSDVERSLAFYCAALGMVEVRRNDYPQGRFTLIFLSATWGVWRLVRRKWARARELAAELDAPRR